jgi:hypothetical protein
LIADTLQELLDMAATFGPMCEMKGFGLEGSVVFINLTTIELNFKKLPPKEYAEKLHKLMVEGKVSATILNKQQFLDNVERAQQILDDFNRRQPVGAKFFLVCFIYEGAENYRSYPVAPKSCVIQ